MITTGLIFNPLGGQFRKRNMLIRKALASMPEVAQLQATNPNEFDHAVRELLAKNITWLIVVGGDGTLQGIINCLFAQLPLARWPILTIVPAGTTNMISLDLGVRGKPEAVLRKISQKLQQMDEREIIKKPVLRIEQTGIKNVYGMLFGLGMIARGVKFSQSSVKQLGMTGNLFTIMIVLRSILGTFLGRPQTQWAPVRITENNGTGDLQEKVYLFALVSALDRLLLGIRPYWGKESSALHATFVAQCSRKFWIRIWPLIAGRGHHLRQEDGYASHNVSRLELLLDDDYIVDGEVYRASSQHGPLRIYEDGPLHFRVL
ncbi:MAG: acylglycerol kinase family protein [Nitrosomonas sp.]|nr:acylglycerol kinase family protein [Nitrosomonas sp.]